MRKVKPGTPEHCKGCRSLNMSPKYGAWCCKLGRRAPRATGECKLKQLKELVH